jgi:NAD(P)-dependent dehydrogenase (short-subunit alcohol dehydrogenase family)
MREIRPSGSAGGGTELNQSSLPRSRLFVGSWLGSTLPSDATSRGRPCVSLALHLHQVVQGTCTPKLSNMLGTRWPGQPAGLSGSRSDKRSWDDPHDGPDQSFSAPSCGCAARTPRRRPGHPAQELDAQGVRGTILNMGTVSDVSPSPVHFGTIAYAASKGAVRALTLAAASRYAPDRIRFNLIAPAVTDTPMAARAVGDPTIRSYLATKMPLSGGPIPPDDVAEAALFLCEPASRLITGAVLTIDAGWRVTEGQRPDDSPR